MVNRTPLLALLFLVTQSIFPQTNPTPQSLPYNQNFGTASFSVLPAGFAVWNGINGATNVSLSPECRCGC